ncbi:hypothetical protein LOC68_12600 [Blastopirellula sp. JC732]|uniref:Uncharacterized protein n=1 Tax=Blastopirellula sediminis TaxID=2894196 RepID=A0A9X1MN26_9BACT|nr:hypothetical protein [Blastopirellula sediminis]MCC9607472.1 hypothetical protein [Blastopirellula sediminis]MCC9629235.1 hypothetical protein [Blastopirellula sediminis]
MRIRRPHPDEVDQLLLNAQLRDELEPYFDESIACLDNGRVPLQVENEFLTAILAWERAPILPLGEWFSPPLQLPNPESLSDEEVHRQLWDAIQMLASKRIYLDFTDHLSDRQLYCIVKRDILTSYEKMVDLPSHTLSFNCAPPDDNPDVWLRYYASEEERHGWEEETGQPLPPLQPSPFPRKLPKSSA